MYTKIEKRKKTLRMKFGMGCLSLIPYFFSMTASAQCAMCRAAIESEGDGTKAEAVNDGIVYLMLIPYILVAVIGFGIYRIRKNRTT